MKKVFRVEFNGQDGDAQTITQEALADALSDAGCPLRFDEVEVTEVLPKPQTVKPAEHQQKAA